MRGLKFIAVSNREPYIHEHGSGRIECLKPASGLTAAIDPIMRASGGVWIAYGSGAADRIAVDARQHVRVPPEDPAYNLRRVWLPAEMEREYYYGLANEGIWPLCHMAFRRPRFRRRDWRATGGRMNCLQKLFWKKLMAALHSSSYRTITLGCCLES